MAAGRFDHFVYQLGHDNANIRERSLQNISSKLRHGIVGREEAMGCGDLTERLVTFLVKEGNSGEAVSAALELILDFTRHPVGARALIRSGAVQMLEQYRGKAPAVLHSHLDAALSNLLTLKVSEKTVYEEVLCETQRERHRRDEEQKEVEAERLKLRLKDRVRARRPVSGDFFYTDLRAKISHANPELALQGATRLNTYAKHQISPVTWVEEGSVLLEVCEYLPVLSRRVEAKPYDVDVRILELHFDTLNEVSKYVDESTMTTELFMSAAASSIPHLTGITRSKAVHLLHALSMKQHDIPMELLSPFMVSLIPVVVDGETSVCSPESVLELRTLRNFLEKKSHDCDDLRDVLVVLIDPEAGPHAEKLAERHPALYDTLADVGETTFGLRRVFVEKSFCGRSKKLLVEDAIVVLNAVDVAESCEMCLDAVAAAEALVGGRVEGVSVSVCMKFFRAQAANKQDALCVTAVCRFLESWIAHLDCAKPLPEDFFTLADVVSATLFPLLCEEDYLYNFHETAGACLSLFDAVLRTLCAAGHAAKSTQIITSARVLFNICEKILSPTSKYPYQHPKSTVEWCLSEAIPTYLVKLTSVGLRVVQTALQCITTYPSGRTPECVNEVQSILLTSVGFVEGCSVDEKVMLPKVALLHQRWVDVAALCAVYLKGVGVEWTVGGSLWGFRRGWPYAFYTMLSMQYSCGGVDDIVTTYPRVVADALAVVVEGGGDGFCEAGEFLLTILLQAASTVAPEGAAMKAVLIETLQGVVFQKTISVLRDKRSAGICLALSTALTRLLNDLTVISPTTHLGTWRVILYEATQIVTNLNRTLADVEFTRGVWELLLIGWEVDTDFISLLYKGGGDVPGMCVGSIQAICDDSKWSGEVLKHSTILHEVRTMAVYHVANVVGSEGGVKIHVDEKFTVEIVREIVIGCLKVICDETQLDVLRATPCCLVATVINSGGIVWVKEFEAVGGLLLSNGLLALSHTNPTAGAALNAVLSISTEAKNCFVESPFYNEVCLPRLQPSDPDLTRAMTTLINLLHNHPPPALDVAWSVSLGRKIRGLLSSNIGCIHKAHPKTNPRLLPMLLQLLKGFLLLSPGQEQRLLYKDLVKGFVGAYRPGVECVSEVWECLATPGTHPKLFDLIPVQLKEEFLNKVGKGLGSGVGVVEVTRFCANFAMGDVGREVVVRVPEFWDLILGVETGQFEGVRGVETSLLIRNLSFRGVNKPIMARETRLVHYLLEALRSTSPTLPATHQKWLATSTMWSLIYNNEKAKSALRPQLPESVFSPIRVLVAHHFSLEETTRLRAGDAYQSPTAGILAEILEHLDVISTLLA